MSMGMARRSLDLCGHDGVSGLLLRREGRRRAQGNLDSHGVVMVSRRSGGGQGMAGKVTWGWAVRQAGHQVRQHRLHLDPHTAGWCVTLRTGFFLGPTLHLGQCSDPEGPGCPGLVCPEM